MILITGGLGFIGLNTARALLAWGRRACLPNTGAHLPEDLKDEMGIHLFIEPLDVTTRHASLSGHHLAHRGHRLPTALHNGASHC